MSNTELYVRNGLQVAPNTRFRTASGNTSQRPATPLSGDFRFNTDSGLFEGYYPSNSTWASISGGGAVTNGVFANSLTIGNSTVNVFSNSTAFKVGANVVVNASAYSVSNSTIAAVLSSGTLQIGSNLTINSTGWGIGNSTVSMVANSTQLQLGTVTLTPTSISVGALTINSTAVSGAALNANNSAYLGGVAANGYLTPSALTPYQTTSGLAAAVAVLPANNATYLGGVAYTSYYTSSNLTRVSQLSNDSGYITGASLSGYQPALSSSGSYTIGVMVATSYLYSDGNIYAQGDVYAAYSDSRFKFVVSNIIGALDRVCSWQGFTYYQNQAMAHKYGLPIDPDLRVGVSAQDILYSRPEAVALAPFDRAPDGTSKSGENFLTVDYAKLVPDLIEAIKELRREIESLKR